MTLAAAAEPPARTSDAPAMAWWALGVFSVVTLFAMVDRTVFILLAEPIRLKMGFSDLQLGLLQGTGVALFAAAASYPLGWLSDRFDRRLILSACIVVWSLAVIGCGAARSFTAMLIASAMVGAGEAGLSPIFYSMIPELFSGQKRQLANSIFALTAAAAGGLAFFISGQIPSLVDALRHTLPAELRGLDTWRLTFFAAAMPAPLMILLICGVPLGGRRIAPAKAMTDPLTSPAHRPDAPPRQSLRNYLRAHAQTLLTYILGLGMGVLGFGALNAWITVILMRRFGETSAQVGSAITPIILLGTAVGFVISIFATRLMAPRLGDKLPIRAIWLAYGAGAVTDLLMGFAPNAMFIYIVAGAQMALTTTASMLAPTAVQSLSPSHLRGRLVAVQTITLLFFGAFAAPLSGFVSDRIGGGGGGLLAAGVAVAVTCLTISTLLLRWCEASYLDTVLANRADDMAAQAAVAA